ncbi:histone-like nucleoid-structuring protein Lsr2 [Saccharopolyspora shandongensis]|uniref:Lsr2 family DNA-binding protein n=1 Tax=Saccharopolyspora shandongensis TaxID=418495 RepID=UPI003434FD1D
MRVRMIGAISGARNGNPWPKPGDTIDLPDEEGAMLCAHRMAQPVEPAAVETRPAPADDVETRPAPAEPVDPVDPAAVRAWAADNDIDVPKRGKLPAAVVDAYHDAHQG